MSDNVNKPSHYNAGGVETIEGIKASLGDGFSDYCLGNVLKYVWRCKHKGKLLEDLRKAAKYLEWAIEAAESNCPEMPDSSSGKAIPIPEGWRELEPDEIPLATDMHEWMGGWVPRKDDATNTYIWHSRRHIRKIETLKPKPLAIPEGWRELEENEPLSEDDLFDLDGEWVGHEYDPSGGFYSSRIHRRHIRKIETENNSEAPNSSIPDPGPGYRLLSKDPPEQVVEGDEYLDLDGEWTESENWRTGSVQCSAYYRRKIETTAWIPKVGDKVRVNYPRRTFDGKVGVIVEGNAGRYAVRLDSENLTVINLEAEHLELIEAAS